VPSYSTLVVPLRRMAQRIAELDHLPHGLANVPAIQSVAQWYAQSVADILDNPEPTDEVQERIFTERIRRIYQRHAPTLVTMARGIAEFKRAQGVETTHPLRPEIEAQVQRFLDVFYTSRIGIRTLIEQHLALHEPVEGYVGIINSATSPVRVCKSAILDAQLMCERALGDSPEVMVYGDEEFTFEFIDSFLHHIVFELVKNATRAVVEMHGPQGPFPPVRVVVAAGSENEDVVVKVSDEGGGIPRSGMPHIWSYFYTSANSSTFDHMIGSEDDFSTNTPLAGLGYGLPLSRLYARYFGGELQVISMEGYGTDAYVHLKRVGDADEPVPPVMPEFRAKLNMNAVRG
jgi:pyruvate dehydrogenase kinase 2/3/4